MYDLFVIGAGSGGVRSARLAAAQGFSCLLYTSDAADE